MIRIYLIGSSVHFSEKSLECIFLIWYCLSKINEEILIMKKTIIFLIFVIIIFIGCENPAMSDKEDDENAQDQESSNSEQENEDSTISKTFLYFGGRNDGVATIWKVDKNNKSDIVEIPLLDGSDYTTVQDIVIYEDDIYALVFNGTDDTLCYYKNSQLIKELPDSYLNGQDFQIFNDKIYIFTNDLDTALYLYEIDQNGTIQKYTVDSGGYPVARDLVIDNNKIYLTGYLDEDSDYPNRNAYVYVGDLTNLTGGFDTYPVPASDTFAETWGLDLSGTTLYICGSEYSTSASKDIGTYWTMDLSDFSISSSVSLAESYTRTSLLKDIVVNNNTVFCTAKAYAELSLIQLNYWSDTTVHNLNTADHFCDIFKILAIDGNIYSVGYETEDKPTLGTTKVARYWENETAYDLTDTTHDAVIWCVSSN